MVGIGARETMLLCKRLSAAVSGRPYVRRARVSDGGDSEAGLKHLGDLARQDNNSML